MGLQKTILVSLYQSIVIPLLEEWLDNLDLCCLDTAYCKSNERDLLLSLLTKINVRNVVVNNRLEVYSWMSLRGMALQELCLDADDFRQPMFLNFLSRANHMDLETMNFFELENYFSRGLSVSTLRLKDVCYTLSIISKLGSITCLDVSSVYNLNDDSFVLIAKHCHNLKVLDVPGNHADISPVFSLPELRIIKNCNVSRLDCPSINSLPADGTFKGNLLKVSHFVENVTFCCKGFFFQLTSLDVYSRFESVFPAECLLINLESLFLSCQADIVHAVATHCTRLTSLTLQWMTLYSMELVVVSILKQNPCLKEVHFCRCTVLSFHVMHTLAFNCPQLTALTFDGRGISEKTLMELFSNCHNLRSVSLGLLLPTDRMVTHLATGLSSLSLSYGSSHKISFSLERYGKELQMYSKHKHLCCYFNFPRVLIKNPLLTRVKFEDMKQLTDYKLKQLVDLCPLLSHIHLHDCPKVTIEGINHFSRCKHLFSLYLYYQHDLTDKFVLDLLSDKPFFRKLALPNSSGFTSQSLALIPILCPLMRSLDFSFSNVITSADVIALLDGCTCLFTLILNHCLLLDASFLNHLHPKMRYVDLSSIPIKKKEWDCFVKSTGFSCSHTLKQNFIL